MKNTLLLILTLFLSYFSMTQDKNGCPSKKDKDYKCVSVSEDILSQLDDSPYSLKTSFKVELESTFRKRKDKIRAQKVLKLVNQVINDSAFWKALEEYENYKFAKWSSELTDTWTEISGEQITNCLINKNPFDSIRPALSVMKLRVKLYGTSIKTPFETAVAKEGNNGVIYNKKWFFRKDAIEAIGSNWLHEYAHSVGVRHCFNCNEDRDYSIPYVINRIFKEVAKKYL